MTPPAPFLIAAVGRYYGMDIGVSGGWPVCIGPMRNGRIISLSSCSTMWQCQTNWPGAVNCAPHAGYLTRERDDRVL